MSKIWPLNEAKAKLGTVIDEPQSAGAQVITRRGQPVAVIMSYTEYAHRTRPAVDLITFFRNSPMVGMDLDLQRNKI